jgi:hypothetical protein
MPTAAKTAPNGTENAQIQKSGLFSAHIVSWSPSKDRVLNADTPNQLTTHPIDAM